MVKKTFSRLAAPHLPADLLFKRNALKESHWNPLAKACANVMALPFWLNDNPVLTSCIWLGNTWAIPLAVREPARNHTDSLH